jgi:hypothetical protein
VKYLRRFLDSEDLAHSWREAPTKPTKLHETPPERDANLGGGTYETGEPGSSPDSPEIDIPADDWRWTVANWPHERWSAWRRRVTTILAVADELVLMEDREDAPRADVEEIRAAERRAFDELTSFAGVTLPPLVVRATP